MDSQIVANIDSELKEKAMKMAKEEGLTLKAVLSFLLKWYIEKEFTFTPMRRIHKSHLEFEELTPEEIKFFESDEIQDKYRKLSELWV